VTKLSLHKEVMVEELSRFHNFVLATILSSLEVEKN
jgi:hypothetical protein